MTDPNVVKIDADEMGAHQKHLAGLTDRITIARDAARTTLSPDAFGVFGSGLAAECVQSQQEGADTLQVALDASNVHHDNVGAWRKDLATNELDLVAMFRVIGEDDD
jgi:hypothetical protein